MDVKILDYTAAIIALVFDGVSLSFLVRYYFAIRSDQTLRLKFLTLTRAAYCAIMVAYLSYEIHALRYNRANGLPDLLMAFALFGSGITSSWLLVHEYLVGARELRFQLSPEVSTKSEIQRRKMTYRITLTVGLIAIWLPIIITLIWFRSEADQEIQKHFYVLLISHFWTAIQEFLLYITFSVILFASITTLRNIASLFPDYEYSKPTLALLYSYASLCVLIPAFDLCADVIGNPKVSVYQAFLQ